MPPELEELEDDVDLMDEPDEEDLDAPDDEPDEDDPPEIEAVSDEQRARAMGWKPLAEFRGDPRQWVDFPEFLRKGDEELPILRDQNRRMAERLARTDGQMQALEARVTDAERIARTAGDAGYQRALGDLKRQQRAAVAEGDTAAYDEIEVQIDAMEEERAKVFAPPARAAPAAAPGQQSPDDPAIQGFIAANADWFSDPTRPHLRNRMILLHNAVIAEHPGMPIAQQLAVAKADLAKIFPDIGDPVARAPAPQQPRPRLRAPSALAPSSGAGFSQPRRRSTDPFDKIPADERAEARAAFAAVQRHDPESRADEYVALYLNPHADIIAMRRANRKK